MPRPGTLDPDALPARMLAVACAEPLRPHELLARVERRYGLQPYDTGTAKSTCVRLTDLGLLRHAATDPGRGAYLYALTREGEAALDALLGGAG